MDAFAQHRTGYRAQRLGLSQLACLGRHTVTGLLYAAGRQFLDWTADYRLYSRDVWEARELFVPITRGIVDLLPPGAPFVGAMDDTPVPKTGMHIPGVAYRRDPLSPAFHTNFIRAQRFLQVSGLLPNADPPGSARAIPIAYEHVPPVPRPKKNAPEEEWKVYRRQRREQNLSTYGGYGVTFTLENGQPIYTSGNQTIVALLDVGSQGGQVLFIGDLAILIDNGGDASNLTFIRNIAAFARSR